MSHYVYILKSLKDGGYYIGETKDVLKRLEFHNSSLQRSTRNRAPFVLVLIEEFNDRKSAIHREKQIKSYKGGVAFIKLISSGSGPA
jgi:putative endonuclease